MKREPRKEDEGTSETQTWGPVEPFLVVKQTAASWKPRGLYPRTVVWVMRGDVKVRKSEEKGRY